MPSLRGVTVNIFCEEEPLAGYSITTEEAGLDSPTVTCWVPSTTNMVIRAFSHGHDPVDMNFSPIGIFQSNTSLRERSPSAGAVRFIVTEFLWNDKPKTQILHSRSRLERGSNVHHDFFGYDRGQ